MRLATKGVFAKQTLVLVVAVQQDTQYRTITYAFIVLIDIAIRLIRARKARSAEGFVGRPRRLVVVVCFPQTTTTSVYVPLAIERRCRTGSCVRAGATGIGHYI